MDERVSVTQCNVSVTQCNVIPLHLTALSGASIDTESDIKEIEDLINQEKTDEGEFQVCKLSFLVAV